jgi:TPR repeat protein
MTYYSLFIYYNISLMFTDVSTEYNIESLNELAKIVTNVPFMDGMVMPENSDFAKICKIHASYNNPIANNNLGFIHYNDKDYMTAINYFQKSINSSNHFAISASAFNIGMMYYNGIIKGTIDEMYNWFRKSVNYNSSNSYSLYALAYIYETYSDNTLRVNFHGSNIQGSNKDSNHLVDLFKNCADKGNLLAHIKLGNHYYSQKDLDTAFSYYIKAIKLNIPHVNPTYYNNEINILAYNIKNLYYNPLSNKDDIFNKLMNLYETHKCTEKILHIIFEDNLQIVLTLYNNNKKQELIKNKILRLENELKDNLQDEIYDESNKKNNTPENQGIIRETETKLHSKNYVNVMMVGLEDDFTEYENMFNS